MNTVKRFRTLLSILALYASNIIVHDKDIVRIDVGNNTAKQITGRKLLKLPAPEMTHYRNT